jgi:hypothetical protein
VAVVCPADVEPIGLGEHLRVAVRRPQRQVQQLTLADRLAAQRQVLTGDPLQELRRAVVPQALLHRRPHQPRVIARPAQLLGVVQQGQDGVAELVLRGDVAGTEQQDALRTDLLGRQPAFRLSLP